LTKHEQRQVVIPKAGVSPSRSASALRARRVKKIIEVDIAGTEEKYRLYSVVETVQPQVLIQVHAQHPGVF